MIKRYIAGFLLLAGLLFAGVPAMASSVSSTTKRRQRKEIKLMKQIFTIIGAALCLAVAAPAFAVQELIQTGATFTAVVPGTFE